MILALYRQEKQELIRKNLDKFPHPFEKECENASSCNSACLRANVQTNDQKVVFSHYIVIDDSGRAL